MSASTRKEQGWEWAVCAWPSPGPSHVKHLGPGTTHVKHLAHHDPEYFMGLYLLARVQSTGY